jgi:hypothetical protein
VKPGYLTTEFWVHGALQVILTLNDYGVWSFVPPRFAVVAQAILAGAYALGRGWAKSNPSVAALETQIRRAEGELRPTRR